MKLIAGGMTIGGVLVIGAIGVGLATAGNDGDLTLSRVWWRVLIGLLLSVGWFSAVLGLRAGRSRLVSLGALITYGLSAAAAAAATVFGFGLGTTPDLVAAVGQILACVLMISLGRYLSAHAGCLANPARDA